jgi:hypothetical protein
MMRAQNSSFIQSVHKKKKGKMDLWLRVRVDVQKKNQKDAGKKR